jgi:hypothetical protein
MGAILPRAWRGFQRRKPQVSGDWAARGADFP